MAAHLPFLQAEQVRPEPKRSGFSLFRGRPMLTATCLDYAGVRREFPLALRTAERSWLISVPAMVGGLNWRHILGRIFGEHKDVRVFFEDIAERGDRVVVLVGVMRKPCGASPSASL
jgi:hypothetical protein